MSSSAPPPAATTDGVVTGRVVRLHFRCRAELPIGSSLRVTGSSLWAPTSLTSPNDPTNAIAISADASYEAGYTELGNQGDVPVDLDFVERELLGADTASGQGIYASSVEMVTSPETYPVWQTKRPVIVVLNPPSGHIPPSAGTAGGITGAGSGVRKQKHYYRYLVVTPGAANPGQFMLTGNGNQAGLSATTATTPTMDVDLSSSILQQTPHGNVQVSTSDGAEGAVPVMAWEQPMFVGLDELKQQAEEAAATAAAGGGPKLDHGKASMASFTAESGFQKKDGGDANTNRFLHLAQLPYRTLDIDVETAAPVTVKSAASASLKSAMDDGNDDTDGSSIPLDTFNCPDDDSFKPFVIRETLIQQQTLEAQRRATENAAFYNIATGGLSGGGGTPAGLPRPPQAVTTNLQSSESTVSSVDSGEIGIDDVDMTVANPEAQVDVKTDGGKLVETHDDILHPKHKKHHSGTGRHRRTLSGHAITQAPKILFICFHLPVVVVKGQDGKWKASWSESLLASKEGSKIVGMYRAHWIGTVTPQPPIVREEDKIEVKKLLADMNCTPIFLKQSTRQAHYYGFCKQVLWPAFHNIDLLDLSVTSGGVSSATYDATSGLSSSASHQQATSEWDQSRLDHWWKAYQQVNKEFAQVTKELVDKDASTYLWIHDYHLSLLPGYLSEPGLITAACRKVFFLHIPFPTSQIFRELECGEEILRGMLHADVVGFHAFDHARHFLNATKRIMGLNYESLVGGLIGVQFGGRTVLVSMSNVSIEPHMLDAAMKLPSVESSCEDLRERHSSRTIICSVDIGQRLSGSSLKLLAFERLLQDYPIWQTKVVMVLRVLVPGSRKRDEQITTRELRSIVQRIHDRYGTDVMDYQEIVGSTLPMDQRLALFKASDILMVTPIREGLNHWPMEYIYSKKDGKPGVVISSEFSAVCSILNGALRVNPFDIQMTVTVMDKALSMEDTEKEGRRYRDLDFVSNSPSDRWVRNVLRDLNDANSSQGSSKGSGSNSFNGNNPSSSSLGAMTPTSSGMKTPRGHRRNSSRIRREELTGTAAFLLKESHSAFTHLHPRVLKQAYDVSSRRVIILDFNGTIVLKEPPGKYLKREILGTSGNKPPPQVLEALQLLCSDPKNTVYVVSGDSSENVMSALGDIPQLGLAVSNGAMFSRPLKSGEPESTQRQWLTFDLGVDWDAVKRVALPVLSKYTARSNGSFVKLTAFSIGWSYYSCDPEWGSLQASHLVLELEAELKAFDVRFVTLKGVVEIVPRMLNKGLVVKKVLRDISRDPSEPPIDFCLCFGDDISDEKMFTSVFSFVAEMSDPSASHLDPPLIKEDGSRQADEPDADRVLSEKVSATLASPLSHPLYCFTCAVGKKPSHASMYVTDAQEVANAICLMAKGEYPRGGVFAEWKKQSEKNIFA
mmetsp:Transcript_56880/g.138475  ORF Transcript_56880/g.138475 Transcript_56880/m.138475 type:complete len:1411 (+) Transcript_56880:138-4370(+)